MATRREPSTAREKTWLALSLWALVGIAGCGNSGTAGPGTGEASARSDGGDTSTADAAFNPATSCGPDAGTACCTDDLVSVEGTGPVFHAEISTAMVSGEPGVGVFDSAQASAPDATCGSALAVGGPHRCRSSWSLTMNDASLTRVESTLPVEDVSWLAGQTVYLATGEANSHLALFDAAGRLLVWQVPMYSGNRTANIVPVWMGDSASPLPLSMRVRVGSDDALCRRWTPPCWLHDVYALEVEVGRETRSLGPGDSFEFAADGLRYRVTDRILASRSELPVGQCADFGRETWSFDLVALGPAD